MPNSRGLAHSFRLLRAIRHVAAGVWFALALILPSAVSAGDGLADQLAAAPGKEWAILCETQATQVAPEARVSAGTLELRLTGGVGGAAGTWTAIVPAGAHAGSIATRHGTACTAGCPLHLSGDRKSVELWVPQRTTIDKAAPGELLTIAVVDSATLRLRASTFLDQQIASLEQGECRRAAP